MALLNFRKRETANSTTVTPEVEAFLQGLFDRSDATDRGQD